MAPDCNVVPLRFGLVRARLGVAELGCRSSVRSLESGHDIGMGKGCEVSWFELAPCPTDFQPRECVSRLE